jgi:hypothetical protein
MHIKELSRTSKDDLDLVSFFMQVRAADAIHALTYVSNPCQVSECGAALSALNAAMSTRTSGSGPPDRAHSRSIELDQCTSQAFQPCQCHRWWFGRPIIVNVPRLPLPCHC